LQPLRGSPFLLLSCFATVLAQLEISSSWKCQLHSAVLARPRAGGYTMGKARPAVIAQALTSSATPPAGRVRIRRRLLKLAISEVTFAAPWHGRAGPYDDDYCFYYYK